MQILGWFVHWDTPFDKLQRMLLRYGIDHQSYFSDRLCIRLHLIFGRNDEEHGFLTIRSIGCIMGELIARKPILCGANENDQLLKIFDLLGTPSRENWPDVEHLPNYSIIEKYEGTFYRCKLKERFPSLSDLVEN